MCSLLIELAMAVPQVSSTTLHIKQMEIMRFPYIIAVSCQFKTLNIQNKHVT